MKTISIQIPEEIMLSLKIPKMKWEKDIKKELALQLYHEGLISFANAHRLAEMSKMNSIIYLVNARFHVTMTLKITKRI